MADSSTRIRRERTKVYFYLDELDMNMGFAELGRPDMMTPAMNAPRAAAIEIADDASDDEGGPSKKSRKLAHAATAKKVVSKLDPIDETIVRMKEAKYLEKKIAEHLEKHYGVKYSPKTIGTRYARLKKVLARHQDELLDQGLADWHDGDDDALQAAIIRAHARIAFRKQKLDDELWRLVAEALKIIKPVTNFSGKACQQRAESLEQGTALPTPETLAKRADPDPLVLERIKTRRQKEERLVEDVQQYQEGCGHVPAQPLNITEAESVNYVDQEPARIGQNADGIAHIHDEPTTSAASVHDAEVDTRRPPESTISTHIAAEEQDPAAVSDLDFLSLHDSTQAPGVLPANRFYTSADQPDFVPGTFAGPVASSFGAGIRDGFGGIGALPLIRPVGGDQMQQAWIGTVESEWERTEANLRGNSWTSWKGL